MKKLLILATALLLATTITAQELRKPSGPVFQFEFRGSNVTNNDKFGMAEAEVAIGYAFNPRLSVFVPLTVTVGLFGEEEGKGYQTAPQLGGGIGYSLLYTDRYQLEIVGCVGSTLGSLDNNSWEYMYYDCGLRFGLVDRCYIGIGVRDFNCYKGGFDNHCVFYAALGFRINLLKSR